MAPQISFGTASFGMDLTEFQDTQPVRNLLDTFKKLNIYRLDTASRYPPLKPHRSEELIGESMDGDLSREAIQNSVADSLKRLQQPEGVNALYAHRADPSTPLKEQVQAFNEQIDQGHCKSWGVSNTPPSVLKEILVICEQYGWKKPSCYQGSYNLVTRGMETEILPILIDHGIKYIAFQNGTIFKSVVLAAGFLTGRMVNNDQANTGFDDKNPLGKAVQRAFGADDLRDVMKKFDTAVRAHGLTPTEVAFRWVAHHSALRDEDGIILGASKTTQIVETVSLIEKGPLPTSLLTIAEGVWDSVKGTRGKLI
ncbi:putative oxidoreductase [Xylogone sp. PMI_703]|nr:putative oxidoreductase [Xylogone sp. PMI_703]